jgi:hypothetical protein
MEKEVIQRDDEDKSIHLKLASLDANDYKNEMKGLIDKHKNSVV